MRLAIRSLPAMAAIAALSFTLSACSSNDKKDDLKDPVVEPPKTEQCAAGETACGTDCCTANEQCNATTSTCEEPQVKPPPPDRLEQCYAAASFSSTSFASEAGYLVDQDGFEYTANHKVDAPYAQMLSVALWPLSTNTALKGTFDLSQEPFSYAQCERCVLVIAGKTETDQKYYLAREGTLTVDEVGSTRIAGSLSNVRLVEVTINETTLATAEVEGGCELEIPALAFEYGEPPDPIDERIAQCFLPESFTSDQFRDFIYPLEANDAGYFYRAIEMPEKAGVPNLTLFVEVYRDGTGSFSLAGAETNCADCYHLVIIEAKAVSGAQKDYVSAEGTLVLTELSETVMAGRLENVRLVETEISGSQFTPVSGGCSTYIERLDFDSRDETTL